MPSQTTTRNSLVSALVVGLTADVVTGFTSLGAGTGAALAGFALDAVMAKRAERARDVLIDELKRGDRSIHSMAEAEELVAILYRFLRAAQEGTARLNLRLMAQVIAGQAHLGNLVADEFLYYADILASLRREEILLIATLHKYRDALSHPMTDMKHNDAQNRAKADLIPGVFADQREFQACAGAAMRTGLVIGEASQGVIAAPHTGGFTYYTSPLMDRLARLTSFEAAVAREQGR